jgi:hypothetical protein
VGSTNAELLSLPWPPLLLPPVLENAWQKGQLRQSHRAQWLAAFFSVQNFEQLSTLWSPASPDAHAAGGGGGALAFEVPLQKEQDRHWQRGQWAPALFSEQNLAQLSTLMSPGKVELQAAPVVVAAEATLAAAASSTSNRMPMDRGARCARSRRRARCAGGRLSYLLTKLLSYRRLYPKENGTKSAECYGHARQHGAWKIVLWSGEGR